MTAMTEIATRTERTAALTRLAHHARCPGVMFGQPHLGQSTTGRWVRRMRVTASSPGRTASRWKLAGSGLMVACAMAGNLREQQLSVS